MRSNRVDEEAVGLADFADSLRGVKVHDAGEATVRIGRTLADPVECRADLFHVVGLGFDRLAFFVAVDPDLLPASALGAGIRATTCLFFEGTARRATRQEAQLEAVKYLLRIPEEERPVAAELMRLHGPLWRAKR